MNIESPGVLNEASSPPVSKEVSSRIFRFLIGIVAVAGTAAVFFALTMAVYLLPFSNRFVRATTSFIPYPVALVNTSPIFFKDFYAEWDALQLSLAQVASAGQEPASAEEQRDKVVDVMIDRLIVRELADDYGLKADSTKIQETLDLLISNSASEEEFYAEVAKNLGWDKEVLIERAIKPMVLAEQVEEAIHKDEGLQQEAREKINGALERLRNNDDFSIVAKEVSEDASAETGGDLGYLKAASLPSEVAAFLAASELNTASGILDVDSAFAVVTATDKVEGEDDTKYAVKAIIVFKKDLGEVMDDFKAASRIWKFLRT